MQSNLNLSVRPATPDDALSIKRIHTNAYKHSYRGFLPDEYLDSLEITDEKVEKTRQYLTQAECSIALYADTPAGFAYVSEYQDCFEINALYIDPEYQKHGLGSLLINTLCKEKQKKGFSKCIVWTMKFGPSLGFYQKNGFTLTAEEKIWKFDIPIIKLEKKLSKEQL